MRIAVVGLGKIGLPFAVNAATHGHYVIGCDRNPEVVKTINSGDPTFHGEPLLDELLQASVSQGNLLATSDMHQAVSNSEVVIVLVPVYVDSRGVPEFSTIDEVTKGIAAALKPGTLVSYETTLPVGTTRNRFTPILEAGSGLQADEEFFVCFSPERVSSGSVMEDLRRYPKLVGGIGVASEARAKDFYEAALTFDPRPDLDRENGVWPMGSAEAAELAKLAETTYRDVNIALANTFALHSEEIGVDIYKVIEACNSQPYSHIHRPGIAVGGHCIPVYPNMYLAGDPNAAIVSQSRKLNLSMTEHAVESISESIGGLKGKTVAILGLAYRGGVKEHAFSGALALNAQLHQAGAIPVVHDPMYTAAEMSNLGLDEFKLGQSCDAVILQTQHAEYDGLLPSDFPGAVAFYDGRSTAPEAIRAMPGYIRLGSPNPF